MEFRDPSDFQPLLKGSEAFVEEDAVVIGPMSLNHDVSVGGTLIAYDHLDISGSFDGRGAVRAMGGLKVQGNFRAQGALESFNTLHVGGNAIFGDVLRGYRDVIVNGSLTAEGSVEAIGRMHAGGDVNVGGLVRAGKAISIEGDLKTGGSLRTQRQLLVKGSIESGGGIKVGREISAGSSIKANEFVWADGPIRCAGPIEATFVYSFIYDLECSYFKTTQLPFGQKFWSEMPPMQDLRTNILGAVRCFEEYAQLGTEADRRKICEWPGWHWITRGHLNNFCGFTERCVPPSRT